MSLVNQLKAYGKEIGIDYLGIAPAEPMPELLALLSARRRAGLACPFEHKDDTLRSNPGQVLPGAKTVIVAALPYAKNLPPSGRLQGQLARVARGEDYHLVLERALRHLALWLAARLPGLNYRLMVDTGPLAERALAVRAGLGWIGKNCCLMVPPAGSWVSLGILVLDQYLEPDPVLEGSCGSCRRCLAACPTGALTEAQGLNYRKCLSYLNQATGYIPHEFRRLMGTRIYGCDTCQEACPHNRGRDAAIKLAPAETKPPVADLISLLNMDKKEFNNLFGQTSAAWCGRRVLRRNAAVALGNLGDPAAVGPLVKALDDPSPLIRGHAAWALGRLGGVEAKEALERALAAEKDETVRQEITLALTNC
ncbi:MAG: tRNA epoxyqueuosine(34) reductase QueG [Bacillota bacterium]